MQPKLVMKKERRVRREISELQHGLVVNRE